MKQYMKLLEVMKTGRKVTVAEIEATLAPSGFLMKRLSSYIWDINHYAKGEVKAEKDGRKVVAYTLTNPEKFKNFSLDSEKAKKASSKPIVVKPMKPVTKATGETATPQVAKAAAKKAVAKKPAAKKVAKPVAKKAAKPVKKVAEKKAPVAKAETKVVTKPARVPAAPVKKPTDHVEAAGFEDLELPDFLNRRTDGVKLAEEVTE